MSDQDISTMTFNELLMYYGDHRECGLEHGDARLKPIIAEIERRCAVFPNHVAIPLDLAESLLDSLTSYAEQNGQPTDGTGYFGSTIRDTQAAIAKFKEMRDG